MSNKLRGEVPMPYFLMAQAVMQAWKTTDIVPWRIEKRLHRRRQLRNGEVPRLTVNTQPLKEIVDYDFFRCIPTSSVARNKAIPSSDIDFAVVVTSEKVSLDRQHAFVEELRRQGFEIYHPDEIKKAQENSYLDNNPDVTREELFMKLFIQQQ